ncbi:hypothetical protein [Nautilia lithotrophica]
MRIVKKVTLFTLYFTLYILVAGCSTKTTPIYAVIKTPKFKAADQGFLEKGFGYKKLIIYKAANAPVEITLKNSYICMNGRCMDKVKFIKEYMPQGYPADFFDKILSKECVDGFYCKKEKNKILFKDKKNNILIMIKELN